MGQGGILQLREERKGGGKRGKVSGKRDSTVAGRKKRGEGAREGRFRRYKFHNCRKEGGGGGGVVREGKFRRGRDSTVAGRKGGGGRS